MAEKLFQEFDFHKNFISLLQTKKKTRCSHSPTCPPSLEVFLLLWPRWCLCVVDCRCALVGVMLGSVGNSPHIPMTDWDLKRKKKSHSLAISASPGCLVTMFRRYWCFFLLLLGESRSLKNQIKCIIAYNMHDIFVLKKCFHWCKFLVGTLAVYYKHASNKWATDTLHDRVRHFYYISLCGIDQFLDFFFLVFFF